MAEWVYVENKDIVEYHGALPKSWRNISGLDKASLDFLNNLGWFPVEKNYVSFDEDQYRIDGYEYQIMSNVAIETLRLVKLTDQELNAILKEKQENFYSSLKQERDAKLKDSDWTQLFDIQAAKSDIWKNNWKNYRQQLRDLPSLYEDTQDYNFSSIVWPEPPQED